MQNNALLNISDITKLIGVSPFDYTLHDQNCRQEWKSWLGSFKWYLKANNIDDDDEKFNKLMHLAGRKVQELYETLEDDDNDVGIDTVARGPLKSGFVPHLTEYEIAIARLDGFFSPRRNATYERHLLRQIQQEKGEKFGTFLMRLRKQAERCGFDDNAEEHIKDQIIEKCESPILRRSLLKLGDVDLAKIIKVAHAFEAVSEQEKDYGRPAKSCLSFEEVCNIRSSSKPAQSGECTRCGFTGHQSFDQTCPAKGKRCNNCGGRDHFSRKCHTKLKEDELSSGAKKRSSTEEDVIDSRNEKKPKLQELVKFVAEDDEYEF